MNRRWFAAVAAAAVLCGCGTKEVSPADTAKTEDPAEREVLFQEATLQNLVQGDYQGSISAAELKKHGDTGIGTFDQLNGELVMTDGVIYRCAGDGSVEAVQDEETIPFCTVTFFDSDTEEKISDVPDFESLLEMLDQKVKELGENYFYLVKIDGTFPEMHVRSEYAQEEPYLPLSEVLKTDQTFFDYTDTEGTMVGLYCPVFVSEINTPGWHFHFVSKDRTKGGHVTGVSVAEAVMKFDQTPGFRMELPSSERFRNFDFSKDQTAEIEEVEKPAS